MKRYFKSLGMAVLFVLLCAIPVQAKTTVKLNKTNVTLYAKESIQLKATITGTKLKPKWSTSNNKIATVNASGKVTAKKAGKVIITAKVNGVSKKCKIAVKANVTDIAKVINKKLDTAVTMLGFKHVTSMDTSYTLYTGPTTYVRTTEMIYTSNGAISSRSSRVVGDTYYRNQAGKWSAHIYDRRIAVFGAKIGMTGNQSNASLKKYGWKLWYDGWSSNGRSSRMYGKNGAIVNIVFRNGKVYEITYQWQLESEY